MYLLNTVQQFHYLTVDLRTLLRYSVCSSSVNHMQSGSVLFCCHVGGKTQDEVGIKGLYSLHKARKDAKL